MQKSNFIICIYNTSMVLVTPHSCSQCQGGTGPCYWHKMQHLFFLPIPPTCPRTGPVKGSRASPGIRCCSGSTRYGALGIRVTRQEWSKGWGEGTVGAVGVWLCQPQHFHFLPQGSSRPARTVSRGSFCLGAILGCLQCYKQNLSFYPRHLASKEGSFPKENVLI